jgi:cytochrome c-type biogenesis protein CcmF
MALMAVGPLLSVGAEAGVSLGKRIVGPLIGGTVTSVAFSIVTGGYSPWAFITSLIVCVALISLFSDLFATIARRMRTGGFNAFSATLATLDGNHRRYGGQLVHVGMLMVMVGVAGSSLYGQKHEVQLTRDASADFGSGWRAQMVQLERLQGANYQALAATITLRSPSGETRTMQPERRFYNKAENALTQVANWSNLQRDAYVTLAGWSDDYSAIALQIYINPLVQWLWIGGVVMVLGSIWCLLPRFAQLAPVSQAQPEMTAPARVARSHA